MDAKEYNPHYLKYREQIRATTKLYQQENKEAYNKYMREYRQKHRDAYTKLKQLENIIQQ